MTQFTLGYGAVRSYKRLSYTPWHALAEFVDNSTQAYFDSRDELDQALSIEGVPLRVDINYKADDHRITITDNSIGMDSEVLNRAMTVGAPPPAPHGRSRYGMGMKTAACWLGDYWTLRTTRLGSGVELSVTVDVEQVASGNVELPVKVTSVDPTSHYTIVDITQMHVVFRGRTIGKIKDYLASMYRDDLRRNALELTWQGEALRWDATGKDFLRGPGGDEYRRTISLEVKEKRVHGWVGILASGSRSQAGFSIFHSGRMIRGWPESWRPEEVFGQVEGSNNLVNQRIVGEFHLDDFPVTHTKDDILWSDEEETDVERAIRKEIADYLIVAEKTRVRVRSGPQQGAIRNVKNAITGDLDRRATPAKRLTDDTIDGRVSESIELTSRYEATEPDVRITDYGRLLRAYFADEEGRESIYAAVSANDDLSEFVAVVNLRHPFLDDVSSTEALDVYLRSVLVDITALIEVGRWSESPQWLAVKDYLMRSLAPHSTEGR